MGNTGVGKTELGKTLAEALFDEFGGSLFYYIIIMTTNLSA